MDDCRPKCWDVALGETKEFTEKEVSWNLFHKKKSDGIQESFLHELHTPRFLSTTSLSRAVVDQDVPT